MRGSADGGFSKLPAGPPVVSPVHVNSMGYGDSRRLGGDFENLPDDSFARPRPAVERRIIRGSLQRHARIAPQVDCDEVVNIRLGQEEERLARMYGESGEGGRDKPAELVRVLIGDEPPEWTNRLGDMAGMLEASSFLRLREVFRDASRGARSSPGARASRPRWVRSRPGFTSPRARCPRSQARAACLAGPRQSLAGPVVPAGLAG